MVGKVGWYISKYTLKGEITNMDSDISDIVEMLEKRIDELESRILELETEKETPTTLDRLVVVPYII
jgi:hypothetical protein